MTVAQAPRLGVIVPSGNAAVEPELNALLSGQISVYASRLPVLEKLSLNERIEQYLKDIPGCIEAFGRLAPDAVIAQCSGSHYLQGPDGDRRYCESLSAALGTEVTSVTQTVLAAFTDLGATEATLVSPYAPWLTELSKAYWEAAGLTIRSVVSVESEVGFSPYDVTGPDLVRQVRQADRPVDEVLLFTGTGMFTLDPLRELLAERKQVMLTSNLCTARWAVRRLLPTAADSGASLFSSWPLHMPETDGAAR
jgi:maleate isomerase